MGKDKATYKKIKISEDKELKELEDKCMQDCIETLQTGIVGFDLYKKCWTQGFNYCIEKIECILKSSKGKK